jgi:hypothetical protein
MNRFLWLMGIVASYAVLHGPALAQKSGEVIVTKSTVDPKRFDCDLGFATFTTPKGWNPNRSGGKTYVILTSEGETYPKITKMISIDGGKPAVPTAKGMADAFAKQWKGKVADEALKVDGQEAYRVLCEPNPKQPQPTDCVIMLKDERTLMFIAGATRTGETDEAMKELIASWKWKKPSEDTTKDRKPSP